MSAALDVEEMVAALNVFADDIEDDHMVRGDATPDEIALLRNAAAKLKAADGLRDALMACHLALPIDYPRGTFVIEADKKAEQALDAYDAAGQWAGDR